jgi:hypothetical protein
MKFKAYSAIVENIDELTLKDCYSLSEIDCSRMMVDLARSNDDSIAVAFGTENKMYGVAGSFRQWEGSAQLWALFSKDVDKYPIALTKMTEALIVYAVEKQKLRRVSLHVRSDYTKGNQFAYAMGFDFEGVMRGFLPDGSDANLYARLF